MKTITILIVLLLSVTYVSGQVSFGEPLKINDNWRFKRGDIENAAIAGFDDSKWRQLDLPHDWSAEGPLSPGLASATGYLPGGIAWYRKTIDIPADMNNKKVYIYFEGIYRNGEVFINGTSLGMRPNGYISYMYDLTPFLMFDEKNLLAIRVDHSKYADSRWYTGSGIYRDVWLVYANPVHINKWGVYVTTPVVNENEAQVQVETTLKNTTTKPATLTVIQELMNKDEKIIFKVSGKETVPAGSVKAHTQALKISRPALWSVDNPYLYQLRTTVLSDKQVIDKNITDRHSETSASQSKDWRCPRWPAASRHLDCQRPSDNGPDRPSGPDPPRKQPPRAPHVQSAARAPGADPQCRSTRPWTPRHGADLLPSVPRRAPRQLQAS
ncbi:MAG: hypothetical protein R6W78_11875 [Bacteroidales bacterium]